jgi:hypothetical protein
MTEPLRPELIVHTFLRPDDLVALTDLWDRIIASGLDRPIRNYPMGLSGSPAMGILGAACAEVPGQVHEAVAYRTPEIIVVSVRRAPNDNATGWDDLNRQWDASVGEAPSVAIGTVRLRIGQWSRWRRGLRPPVSRYEHEDELVLWETTSPGDVHRVLTLMGPARAERAIDRWAWFLGGPTLPSLTRYLVHAAAIRHQAAVLEKALPRLRTARDRADAGCGVLIDLLRAQHPSVTALAAADQALGTVVTEQGGLLSAEADATDMAQTVSVARRAMSSALGSPAEGPPAEDLGIATWLEEQLATELTYLRSVQRKATELSRLVSAVVEERRHRRQENLNLLQASVVGALLMALAASQTFGYKGPIHRLGPVLLPLIVLLSTLALLLPPAVLYWPDRAGRDRPTRRLHLVYLIGAFAFGLEAGWLGTSVRWVLATGHGAPSRWSGFIALGGAVVSVLVALIPLRRWRS